MARLHPTTPHSPPHPLRSLAYQQGPAAATLLTAHPLNLRPTLPCSGAWPTDKRIAWMCTQQPPTHTCRSRSPPAARRQQQPRRPPSQQRQRRRPAAEAGAVAAAWRAAGLVGLAAKEISGSVPAGWQGANTAQRSPGCCRPCRPATLLGNKRKAEPGGAAQACVPATLCSLISFQLHCTRPWHLNIRCTCMYLSVKPSHSAMCAFSESCKVNCDAPVHCALGRRRFRLPAERTLIGVGSASTHWPPPLR